MEYSEQMLVLQVGRFKESDMWVRLLSPTKGILSAFAFGGSRSKQRFPGCLDIFNHVFFRVKIDRKDGYTALQEGVLIRGVNRLRSDRARLGLARNCVKFLQSFGVGPEGAGEAHTLLVSSLALLEDDIDIPVMFPLYFRARMAFDHGYSIDFDTCSSCGNSLQQSGGTLLVRDGLLLCEHCASKCSGFRVHLDLEICAALKAIKYSSPSTWAKLKLSSKARSTLAMAIDGFIQYHVGLCWDQGRFIWV